MSEDPRGADTHASAPTPLPRHNKHEFVRTSLEAGKVPTAPMLEALVQVELRPHLISRRRRCDFKVARGSPALAWVDCCVQLAGSRQRAARPPQAALSWAFWTGQRAS